MKTNRQWANRNCLASFAFCFVLLINNFRSYFSRTEEHFWCSHPVCLFCSSLPNAAIQSTKSIYWALTGFRLNSMNGIVLMNGFNLDSIGLDSIPNCH